VLFVERIAPSVQEVGVAGCAAHVFGRSGARACDAARVFDASFARCGGHFDDVSPAVAEVVFVADDERCVIGNGEVGEAYVACLESLAVGPAVLVELRRAAGQAADVELLSVQPNVACSTS
jgi:hypothetical protein